ncbi:mechanosensitive ion channel domain-containing protein [Motiliproteus sediminis]|uniref:mechanosensitive ion channel domain-containing protein n=1 Tax=Motiliproteus sediminis TaxID=1468178 RepID=UPI001AEF7AB7|nr:mechanosensitive ion channel domain-containing protein [Motiliproteus sediminis]
MLLRLQTVLLLFLTFMPVAIQAEESASRFQSLTLNLNDLAPAWWEGYVDASAAEKARFHQLLETELKRVIPADSRYLANKALLLQLAADLQRQSTMDDETLSLPDVQQRYSLDEWVRVVSRSRELERQQAEVGQKLNQLATTIGFHRKSIAAALLRYRELSVQDADKKALALTILREQLELLAARSDEQRLKKHISQLDNAAALVKEQAQIGLGRLDLSDDDRQQLAEKLEALRTKIEQQLKQQADLRLSTLQQAGSDSLQQPVAGALLAANLLVSRAEEFKLERLQGIVLRLSGSAPDAASGQGLSADELALENTRLRNELNRIQEQVLGREGYSDRQRYGMLGLLQQARTQSDEATKELATARSLQAYLVDLERSAQTWWQSPLQQAGVLWDRSGALLLKWLNYPLFSVNESPVSSFDIFWMILIVTVAGFVSRQLRRLIIRIGTTQQTFSDAAAFTISRILHYVVMAIAVVLGLSSIGLDLSNVALVAGALSVGIGFGLQSIFNNFISGLILLFERPFKVGDLVELESGVRGRIRSINVRSTHINTWDNVDVLVPNSEFIGGRVTNYTLSDDVRRLHISFGVAYGSNKEKVRQAVLNAAKTVPYTLYEDKREPDVWLLNFGDSSLDFELVVWIHHNRLPAGHNPTTDYLWAIETALGEAGIEIPFPQRDLHLRSVDGKLLARVTPPTSSSAGTDTD